MGVYLLYPNISKVGEWKKVIEERNNTMLGEWRIVIKKVNFEIYPKFTEYMSRADGSLIIREISMVTHSPRHIVLQGNIVECNTVNSEIDMSFIDPNFGKDQNFKPAPVILESRIVLVSETYVLLAILLIPLVLIILAINRILRMKRKTDEFDLKVASILKEFDN